MVHVFNNQIQTLEDGYNLSKKVDMDIQCLFTFIVNGKDYIRLNNDNSRIVSYDKDKLLGDAAILIKVLSNLKVENIPTPEELVSACLSIDIKKEI